MTFIRISLFCLMFTAVCGLSAEDLNAFLQKARAHLGPEAMLENVESIYYRGSVYTPQGQKVADLELYFDKPNRQLLRENRDGVISQMAVNGFEGYQMSVDQKSGGHELLQVMSPAQVNRLMSNAAENLYFFQGPEHIRGAEIVDDGVTEYNGKSARKIQFVYPNSLVYIRYFDVESGRLLATVDNHGATMMEKDTLEAGGIKFPKIVVTYNEIGEEIHRVEFEEIEVNGKLESGLFDFPN